MTFDARHKSASVTSDISGDPKYPSLLRLAMQLRLGAVRAFKVDVDFVAVEGEGPPLDFAVPQDSSLHHKGVVVEPTPFDGVDAIGCRALSIEPVEADGS
jgi:hypothetical protein